MKNRTVFNEWMSLSKEERYFVRLCIKENEFSINEVLAEKAIALDFLKVNDSKLSITNKFFKFQKGKMSQSLNISGLRIKLASGFLKEEDVLLSLDILEERIRELREDIPKIVNTINNCNHVFKPFSSEQRICLFGINTLYTWIYKCNKCSKKKIENTKNEEDNPEGFEHIRMIDTNVDF